MSTPISPIPPAAPAGRPYTALVKLVEDLFARHGDTHTGLGYPKPVGFDERFRVFLDVAKFGPRTEPPYHVLDIGCATGCLLDRIKADGRSEFIYRGVDLSPLIIETARAKHPEAEFILGDPFDLADLWSEAPDYVIMGGLFMCRHTMNEEQMTDYMLRLVGLAFTHCRRGVAFNVMSKHVDWEREDLFHVPFDRMAQLLQANFSRNYAFRADYGLYEYTVYLYK
jgi:SAM-dependent methyltransferase